MCIPSNAVLLDLLLGNNWLCMLSNAVFLGLLLGDNWLCMLSNAVHQGLLLVRQLVEYIVKLYSPRVFTG